MSVTATLLSYPLILWHSAKTERDLTPSLNRPNLVATVFFFHKHPRVFVFPHSSASFPSGLNALRVILLDHSHIVQQELHRTNFTLIPVLLKGYKPSSKDGIAQVVDGSRQGRKRVATSFYFAFLFIPVIFSATLCGTSVTFRFSLAVPAKLAVDTNTT